jgi:hypothetical protein
MNSQGWLNLARAFLLLATALCVGPSGAEAQGAQVLGRIIKDAPLFLVADATRQPLLIMEAGVFVDVHRREGNWVQVTVSGSRFGQRTGYVEARFIEVEKNEPVTALRGTAAETIPPKKSEETSKPVASVAQNLSSRPAPATRVIGTTETFQRSTINLTVEDKTRELDVIVRYEPSALVIVDKRTGAATKTYPYGDLQSAEYSYAKNPRWKTAIFVSPLFLFTSGKKHWFLVQGTGDYALLHLDKSNYRLILAAFEARTGLKVETVTDTK